MRARLRWVVAAAARGLEVHMGDGGIVYYGGGDDDAAARDFCAAHRVVEASCAAELRRMSREADAPFEAYENATGDPRADYAASACDDSDIYVSVTNRAIVESLSDVDDWFEAEPWRPRGAALADAVEKRIVDERRSYVVFPRFYDAAATQELRDELDRMFHGDACARNRAYDAGVGNVWSADAFSAVVRDHLRVAGLQDAAERVIRSTAQGRRGLEAGYVEPSSHALHQDMSVCAAGDPRRSPLCGAVSVSPAAGYHCDHLQTAVKALLYLDDVRADNGPFSVLENYPVVTNAHGFEQPDPRVLPVCDGDLEATGKRVLRFSEGHVVELLERGLARSVVLNGSRASLTNIYGLQSRDALRDFPADTVKDHLHRVYHGFTAGDSPAVSAERAALAGGYTPRCDQMSAWWGPQLRV
ncbi:hypothetical protein JL722_7960 [Aureococcus anophagefferens]|nr:hypothetical protein JL722_7960 [Aureococcus anophagefferens]